MQPEKTSIEDSQISFFQPKLSEQLDQKHPLYRLSDEIDWSVFESVVGGYFSEDMGRPALPVRLMVGLHYLKYTYSESDESVVSKFVENPYWQYFCGYESFQMRTPCSPTSLVHWRKIFGEEGMELLLEQTLEVALKTGSMSLKDFSRVNVDTTVQEKAIAFPTDARLYHKMRRKLVKAAKNRKIDLRQSYERLGQESYVKQGRYSCANQLKRARRETRRLRVYLGRVIRDIERKSSSPDKKLSELLERAKKIFDQKRNDKNKVYSAHAPEVECIAKGKVHKKYEFGNKVSVVSTSQGNWCVGVKSYHGNPFDGHTLKDSIDQMESLTGYRPKDIYVDKGYRGKAHHPEGINVHLPKSRKKLNRTQRIYQRRRSALESIISHLKIDHRMNRNYLKGQDGDKINAVLSACGFNLGKLIRAFLFIQKFMCQLRLLRRIVLRRVLKQLEAVSLQAHGGAGRGAGLFFEAAKGTF